MIELIAGKYNYWIYVLLMMAGFYTMIAKENLIKKIIGMNIFQTAVFLFYISISKVQGGTAPIEWVGQGGRPVIYDNPLPHVLILTAIVVSVSTTAVALALAARIYKEYGTLEEDLIISSNAPPSTGRELVLKPEGPLAPIKEGPLVPIKEGPVVPVKEGPVVPVKEGPVVPVKEGPVVPVKKGSVTPVVPVKEGSVTPVVPVKEGSVTPVAP